MCTPRQRFSRTRIVVAPGTIRARIWRNLFLNPGSSFSDTRASLAICVLFLQKAHTKVEPYSIVYNNVKATARVTMELCERNHRICSSAVRAIRHAIHYVLNMGQLEKIGRAHV